MGPLWEEAIGLSGSGLYCGPPITCWNQAPTFEPAGTVRTLVETGVRRPVLQDMESVATFSTGLLTAGVRTPTSDPWSASLMLTRWKRQCPNTEVVQVARARRVVERILRSLKI